MSKAQRGYRSYLLRLWQAHIDGELVWRASLQSPHTHERRGFANLEALFTFLENEIGGAVQGQTALGVDREGGDDRGRKPCEQQNRKSKIRKRKEKRLCL